MMLLRLFGWGNESDADEDSHKCRKNYAITARNGYEFYSVTVVDDGINCLFCREVRLECQECGETRMGFDRSDGEIRLLKWDGKREPRDEELPNDGTEDTEYKMYERDILERGPDIGLRDVPDHT